MQAIKLMKGKKSLNATHTIKATCFSTPFSCSSYLTMKYYNPYLIFKMMREERIKTRALIMERRCFSYRFLK